MHSLRKMAFIIFGSGLNHQIRPSLGSLMFKLDQIQGKEGQKLVKIV